MINFIILVKVIKHKGGGDLKVWRVENFKLSEVAQENYGLFFSGDSCIPFYLLLLS